jgi:hypothetical protein
MSTWQDRLKAAIGPRGYENCMRRSLQTVLLYEAKRCVAHRLPSLRPFQRKAAYMDQALALLDSLDFLYPHQKSEVLWRTASSKEHLDADIAWKREKGIEKEMSTLAKKIKPFVAKAQTHEEAVNMLIQDLYESLTGFAGKPYPLNWEHAHNHVIMAYRMYFRYDQVDSAFPLPISPREIAVPLERPKVAKAATAVGAAAAAARDSASAAHPLMGDCGDDEPHVDVAELLGEGKAVVEDRRKVLQEVREHLELLKQFDGVISDEDLAKRKRELFLALPNAPPPHPSASPDAKKIKPSEI